MLHRSGTDDDPARAGLPRGPQILEATDSAPDLHRYSDRVHDLTDQIQLHEPALAGAVEIHDVERPRPPPLPLEGALDGICVVLPRPPEVPLHEAHAPAAPQVYGRIDGETVHRFRAHLKKFS